MQHSDPLVTSHSQSWGFILVTISKSGKSCRWPAQPRWHQISCKWASLAAILSWGRSCPSEELTKSTWHMVYEIWLASFRHHQKSISSFEINARQRKKNLQCYHPSRKDLLERYGSFVQIIYGLENGLRVQKPEGYRKNEFYFPEKTSKPDISVADIPAYPFRSIWIYFLLFGFEILE